jgi:hypothetical protein
MRTRRSSGRKRNDGVSLGLPQAGEEGTRKLRRPGVPAQARRANDELRQGSPLAEQDGRLQRRLSAADDGHTTTAQLLERGMLGGVRDEFVGKTAQLRRHVRERHDAGRDHDAARGDEFAVRELEHEAERIVLDAHDVALVDVSDRALAEPVAVRDERVERHRTGDVVVVAPRLGAKVAERVPPARVAEAGREALGLEEHSFWHVRAPRAHRPAEDAYRPGRCFQMRRDRKPVGPRAYDGDLAGAAHGDDLPSRGCLRTTRSMARSPKPAVASRTGRGSERLT